jgi:hypothetical protein
LPRGPKYPTSFKFLHFVVFFLQPHLVTQLLLFRLETVSYPFVILLFASASLFLHFFFVFFATLFNVLSANSHFPLSITRDANSSNSFPRLNNNTHIQRWRERRGGELSSNVLHSTSTGYPAARLSSQDPGRLRYRSHPTNPSCRKILHHHQRTLYACVTSVLLSTARCISVLFVPAI